MSADPNKKSGRSFQCRDVLWDTFEQMARELECSVDYLINEAMKQYARQRRAPGASPGQPSRPDQAGPPPSGDPRHYGGGGGMPMPSPPQGRAPGLAPPPGRVPPPPNRGGAPMPVPPPPMHRASPSGVPAPPPRTMTNPGMQ